MFIEVEKNNKIIFSKIETNKNYLINVVDNELITSWFHYLFAESGENDSLMDVSILTIKNTIKSLLTTQWTQTFRSRFRWACLCETWLSFTESLKTTSSDSSWQKKKTVGGLKENRKLIQNFQNTDYIWKSAKIKFYGICLTLILNRINSPRFL